MANLTSSSQLCIRIVLAFLQFLSTVQSANKEEKERIKSVAKNLRLIFKINEEKVEDDEKISKPGILVTLFRTPQDDTDQELEESDDEPSCSSTTAPTAKRTSSSSSKGSAVAACRNMVSFQKEFKQIVLKYGGLDSLLGHANPKKRINAIIGKIFNQALGVISQEGHSRSLNMKDVAEALKKLGTKSDSHF
ncbi:uncharacterized protein LOC129285648 [Prosopis cineraria]|uniref:uncharacterized protein LOC129285648 n=1 Tax=Prosopis cineraria TaxID=364024 RepID=UPI00240EE948|nr:uncharacterized protein LOC129285648 [Prosopis cineraria]